MEKENEKEGKICGNCFFLKKGRDYYYCHRCLEVFKNRKEFKKTCPYYFKKSGSPNKV